MAERSRSKQGATCGTGTARPGRRADTENLPNRGKILELCVGLVVAEAPGPAIPSTIKPGQHQPARRVAVLPIRKRQSVYGVSRRQKEILVPIGAEGQPVFSGMLRRLELGPWDTRLRMTA